VITFTDAQLAAWAGAVFWPLVRVLALFGTSPVFSHRSIPLRAKVAIGAVVAAVLAPDVAAPPLGSAFDLAFFGLLLRNILIGASLGFSMRVLFSGIELAGQMTGLQIGLSFSGFFNPEAADTDNPIANLISLLVLALFVAIDGHLVLLVGLRRSFDVFPIASGPGAPIAFDHLAQLGGQIFSIALLICLPILAVMLLINIVLGVMARVSPQLNLFAVGFPLTLSAGIVILLTFLPYLAGPIRATLERFFDLWPGSG
jgi:flagellar biosynthetic protein FliR